MLRRNSGRGRRFATGAAVLTTLTVAATGCSSGGSSRASSSPAPSLGSTSSTSSASATSAAPTTPAAPTTTAAASTSQSPVPTTSSSPVSKLTGSYLKTLLPGNANESMLGLGPTMPSDWPGDPYKEEDSGAATTAPAPSLVSADNCNYLTAKSFDLAGGLSVATASEPIGTDNAGAMAAFHAYQPGDAAKSLAQVRQNVAEKCDSFLVMGLTNVQVDISATPVSGLGDEALLIKTKPQGPYIADENLLVRRGDLMLSLWTSNAITGFPDLSKPAFYLVRGLG